MDGVNDRARRLVDQVMKTWMPHRYAGNETPEQIAQSSVMIAIAYIMGRKFFPSGLTDNQRAAIDSGLVLMNDVLAKPFTEKEMKMSQPMRELPRYKSHKIVHALKIHAIDLDLESGAAVVTPADEGYGPFPVTAEYIGKHKPRIGGYYVVYEDGYRSWSPAEAFEKGYIKLDGDYSPLAELKAALQADEDFAWTWLCNLACIATDAGANHESANRRAAAFLRNALDVDVRKQDNWQQLEKQWAAEADRQEWLDSCEALLQRLQKVIDSPRKRTHEQMKSIAEKLQAMGLAVAKMELTEVEPS